MLKIFNSLTKQIEEFVPKDPHNIKIYICGPTVYDHSHIGHARTYLTFDVIRNILEKYFNYNVTLVMNITDIDDKIINKSIETNTSMSYISTKYTQEFLCDMDLLKIRRPSLITKVTDYIEHIKIYIDKLIDGGYAYKIKGSWYFDIAAYKTKFEYPIFKTQTESMTSNEDKKSVEDFALWKKADKSVGYLYKGEYGRPGWHIECSVMANDTLGSYIDIHAGGVDLKFPHHENEIAQCQAFYNKAPWVNCFMHTGHLNINGLKMSKSLKNFTTIKSILKRCSPVQLRILFLYHHWNKDMNYEEGQIRLAESVEKKIFNFLLFADQVKDKIKKDDSKIKTENNKFNEDSINLTLRSINNEDQEILKKIKETSKLVHTAFCNNFDTPSVIKGLVDLVTFVNTRLVDVSINTLHHCRDFVKRILNVLGINQEVKEVDQSVMKLAEIINEFRDNIRNALKKDLNKKDFYIICDEVRTGLSEIGFVLEDNPNGTIIKRL